MSTAIQAVELIAQKGSLLSPEIGEALGISAVDTWLKDKVDDGTLVTCSVQRPGQPPCLQYRVSVKAGGELFEGTPGRPAGRKPDPLVERLKEWKPAPSTKKPEAAQVPSKRGNAPKAEDSRKVEPAGRASVRPACASGLDVEQVPHRESVGERLNSRHADEGEPSIGPIEKDVQPPPLVGELRLALREMEVGDSRLIAGYTKHMIGVAASREGISHLVRKEGPAFRVWRVKPS